jgi:hypothetical protein
MPNEELQVEIWKKTVEVQQHFNDLELRIRNFALAVLGAFLAFGGSALKDGGSVSWGGIHLSVAGLIVLSSLVPLTAFYLMDRLWYHRLLYGAVKAGAAQETVLEGAGYTVSLGSHISAESAITMWGTGWQIRSTRKMDIFYAVLAATVVVVGSGLTFGVSPPKSSAVAALAAPAPVLRLEKSQRVLIIDASNAPTLTDAPTKVPTAVPPKKEMKGGSHSQPKD